MLINKVSPIFMILLISVLSFSVDAVLVNLQNNSSAGNDSQIFMNSSMDEDIEGLESSHYVELVDREHPETGINKWYSILERGVYTYFATDGFDLSVYEECRDRFGYPQDFSRYFCGNYCLPDEPAGKGDLVCASSHDYDPDAPYPFFGYEYFWNYGVCPDGTYASRYPVNNSLDDGIEFEEFVCMPVCGDGYIDRDGYCSYNRELSYPAPDKDSCLADGGKWVEGEVCDPGNAEQCKEHPEICGDQGNWLCNNDCSKLDECEIKNVTIGPDFHKLYGPKDRVFYSQIFERDLDVGIELKGDCGGSDVKVHYDVNLVSGGKQFDRKLDFSYTESCKGNSLCNTAKIPHEVVWPSDKISVHAWIEDDNGDVHTEFTSDKYTMPKFDIVVDDLMIINAVGNKQVANHLPYLIRGKDAEAAVWMNIDSDFKCMVLDKHFDVTYSISDVSDDISEIYSNNMGVASQEFSSLRVWPDINELKENDDKVICNLGSGGKITGADYLLLIKKGENVKRLRNFPIPPRGWYKEFATWDLYSKAEPNNGVIKETNEINNIYRGVDGLDNGLNTRVLKQKKDYNMKFIYFYPKGSIEKGFAKVDKLSIASQIAGLGFVTKHFTSMTPFTEEKLKFSVYSTPLYLHRSTGGNKILAGIALQRQYSRLVTMEAMLKKEEGTDFLVGVDADWDILGPLGLLGSTKRVGDFRDMVTSSSPPQTAIIGSTFKTEIVTGADFKKDYGNGAVPLAHEFYHSFVGNYSDEYDVLIGKNKKGKILLDWGDCFGNCPKEFNGVKYNIWTEPGPDGYYKSIEDVPELRNNLAPYDNWKSEGDEGYYRYFNFRGSNIGGKSTWVDAATFQKMIEAGIYRGYFE